MTVGRMKRQAGVTLMELMIAVALLSLLSVGLMFALRIGLTAYSKTQTRLMDNRRVAGAQRILEQQLEGMMPVVAPCGGPQGGGTNSAFFQGGPQTMRLVSTFSLQQAWRGQPQILEVMQIPGADGRGVRLVVNEVPYPGAIGAGLLCAASGQAGPGSFVLADKLAFCRFSYQTHPRNATDAPVWVTSWSMPTWPRAIRVEMEPLEPDPGRLQPITITAPIRLLRSPEIPYGDY
jgi:prepilin-type N-terminal cleavage/methylation domain-containing protein